MTNPHPRPRSRNLIAFLIVPLAFLAFVILVIFLLKYNDELDRRILANIQESDGHELDNSQTGDTEPSQPIATEAKFELVDEGDEDEEEEEEQSQPTQGPPKPDSDNPRAKDQVYWRDLDEFYEAIQDRRQEPERFNQPISRLLLFLDEQYVAAYGPDDQDQEVLLRIFPCSSGMVPGHTPLGLYHLGAKWPESWLFDNALAQYGYQITGNILFHSLPSYDGSLKSGLKLSDLNSMGYAASHGCVRLFCMDAKWLYENAPVGCPVEVLQNRGDKYQDLPDHIFYLRLKSGAPQWDPTDPDPSNPYLDKEVLQKWAQEEPWLEDYEVIPPVWPDLSSPAPVPQEVESTSQETQPAYTGPTSPPPLDPNKKPDSQVLETSPPPLAPPTGPAEQSGQPNP